jgi:putative tricarboxylic transport membrane protein
MLSAQGDLSVMWSNPLVGSITTLAVVMLFWPLLSKLVALLRRPDKSGKVPTEQPGH